MGAYVTTAQVGARLPYRTIDSASSPSASQVDEWIDEAEAILNGALSTIEVTAPITAAAGIKICRSWVLDYAVGHTRMAYAAAGGDSGNDSGVDEIERFNERIEDIFRNSSRYNAMLSGGAGSDSSRQIRAYTTDNADSKTVSGGDFDPNFTTGEKF